MLDEHNAVVQTLRLLRIQLGREASGDLGTDRRALSMATRRLVGTHLVRLLAVFEADLAYLLARPDLSLRNLLRLVAERAVTSDLLARCDRYRILRNEAAHRTGEPVALDMDLEIVAVDLARLLNLVERSN